MSICRCWQAQHCLPFCRLQIPITLAPVLKANTCVTGPCTRPLAHSPQSFVQDDLGVLMASHWPSPSLA